MSDTFFTAWESSERTPDPCAGKHHGNPQSVDAFGRALPCLGHQREEVYSYVVSQGMHGCTVKELARYLGHPGELNRYSGRLAELKAAGRIVDSKRRREGCAVVVSIDAIQ